MSALGLHKCLPALIGLAILLGGQGGRRAAAAPSRCEQTPARISCTSQELYLPALAVPRKLSFELPLGTPPPGGWPVVLYFQGSFFAGSGAFAADRLAPFGMYELTRTVKVLLDAGYAVLAPDALLGGTTFWQTNIPPWDVLWSTSSDHAFMLSIFQAIADGRLGELNPERMYAMGISSGGFMTSRMAVSYRGRFRALAIHSASYAICGPICLVPALPSDHPPTLFLHGLLDLAVPLPTMEVYRDALARSHHEVKAVINNTAGHQWIPEGAQAILDWFSAHH